MTARTLPDNRIPNKQEPLYGISEAAKLLGVSPSTLRRWETEGRLVPVRTSGGNHRRYSQDNVKRLLKSFRQDTDSRRTNDVKPQIEIPEYPLGTSGRLPPKIPIRTLEQARQPFRRRKRVPHRLVDVTLLLISLALLYSVVTPLTQERLERVFANPLQNLIYSTVKIVSPQQAELIKPGIMNPIVDVNDVFEYTQMHAGGNEEGRGTTGLRAKLTLIGSEIITQTLRVVKNGVFNTTQLLGTIFFGEGKRYFINRLGDATLRAATFFERVAIKTGITAGTALKISFEKATQTGDLTGVEVDFSKITDPPSTLTRYGVRLKDSSEPTATDYGVYVEGTNWDYGIYSEDDIYIDGTLEVNDDTTITGNLLPGIDSTHDIGAVDREWANLYVDTLSAFGGTLSSLTVTGSTSLNTLTTSGQSDLQGDVLDTTGNLTLNDTVDISGALNVTGATTLSDTLTVAGATTLSSTLDVIGATTLSSTLDVIGDTTISADLNVGGDLSVTGSVSGGATDLSSLIVTGTSDLRGDVLDTTGNLTLNDSVDVSGDLTVSEQLALNGAAINDSYAINSLITDGETGLYQTITAGDSYDTYGVRNIIDLNVAWGGGYSVYSEFTDSAEGTYSYGVWNEATLSEADAWFYGTFNSATSTGANALLWGSDSSLIAGGTGSTVYGDESYIKLQSTATGSEGYGFKTQVQSYATGTTSYGLYNWLDSGADNTESYGVYTSILPYGNNATAHGSYVRLSQYEPTTQTLYGNRVRLTTGAGDTAYGGQVFDYMTSGGTQYGYYVNLSDPDSTNWSFYGVDGGGNAYFGDDVSVGDDLTAGGTISGTDFTCTNCLDFAEFEDTLDLDDALTLNQGTNTWTQNFTGATTTGFSYAANSLTSGKALNISSSATAFTGDLIDATLSGSNAANTGSLLSLTNSGTSNTNTAFYIKHYATGTNNLAMRVDDVSGDTTPFVIDGGGNVGIGTTGPGTDIVGTYDYPAGVTLLQVDGTQSRLMARGSSDVALDLVDTGGVANEKWMQLFNADGTTKFRVISDAGAVQVDNILVIDNTNGNVGVGIAPTTRFEVSGAAGATNPEIAITGPISGTPTLTLFGGAGGVLPIIGFNDDGALRIATITGVGGAGFVERVRIDSSGNVGIGTTGPSSRLSVKAGSAGVTTLDLVDSAGGVFGELADSSGSGAGGLVIRGLRNAGQGGYGLHLIGRLDPIANTNYGVRVNVTDAAGTGGIANGALFGVQENGTEMFRVHHDGYVGIGTTSPDAKLNVEGTNVEIRAQSTANTGSAMLKFADTSGTLGYMIQYDSSHASRANDIKFSIPTGGDFEFTGGNVGIGVTESNYPLQVNTSSSNIAIFGYNTQASTNNYGIYGQASGAGTTNYGVYGTANTATTNWAGYFVGNVRITGAHPDLAEIFPITPPLEEGDIVVSDPQKPSYVKRSNVASDPTIIGIYSTDPSQVIEGKETENIPDSQKAPIGLVGRILTKVTSLNGPISSGDPITSSEIPGVGMKAIKAGPIVGKALEPYDNPDPNAVGKIMVFVNVSWYDPQVFLSDMGDLVIQRQEEAGSDLTVESQINADFYADSRRYELVDATGGFIERVGAFSEVATAYLKAGRIDTQELFIGEQSLEEYLKASMNAEGGETPVAEQSSLQGTALVDTEGDLAQENSNGTTEKIIVGEIEANQGVFERLTVMIEAIFEKITAKTAEIAEAVIQTLRVEKAEIKTLEVGALSTGESSDTAGSGIVKEGGGSVTIESLAVTERSKIYVTFTTDYAPATRFWVVEKKTGESFTVELDAPVAEEAKFDYWIVN